jgi:hypothetical protein
VTEGLQSSQADSLPYEAPLWALLQALPLSCLLLLPTLQNINSGEMDFRASYVEGPVLTALSTSYLKSSQERDFIFEKLWAGKKYSLPSVFYLIAHCIRL